MASLQRGKKMGSGTESGFVPAPLSILLILPYLEEGVSELEVQGYSLALRLRRDMVE